MGRQCGIRHWVMFCFLAVLALQGETGQPVKLTMLMGSESFEVPAGSQVFFLGNLPPTYISNHSATHHINNNQHTINALEQSMRTSLTISMDDLARFKDSALTHGCGLVEFLTNYVVEHPFRVGASTLGLGYGILSLKMLWLSYTLQLSGWWSQWREGALLAQLFNEDEKTLLKDLLCAIDQHYAAGRNVVKDALPLLEFMYDVDRESALLKKYAWWCTLLATTRMAWAFYVNKTLQAQVQMRLDRLAFFKSRVMRYISSAKIMI